MNALTISCIIPTCDREVLLKEALASVLTQTRPPDEIVVINNGLHPLGDLPNGIERRGGDMMPYAGVAQARNFGAVTARRQVLAFLDDDDLWEPDYLEVGTRALADADCVVGIFKNLKDGTLSPGKNADGRLTIANLLVRNPGVTGSNVIIRREMFMELGGYDPYLPPSEDKSLVLELLLKGGRCTVVPAAVVHHRVHGDPRLASSPVKMARGITHFIDKYGPQMNGSQRAYNRGKIHFHKAQSAPTGFMRIYHRVLSRLLLATFRPAPGGTAGAR